MYTVQDMEVIYYHAYIDGVDFVFIDNPIFHHVENDIYGGDRTVSNGLFSVTTYHFIACLVIRKIEIKIFLCIVSGISFLPFFSCL